MNKINPVLLSRMANTKGRSTTIRNGLGLSTNAARFTTTAVAAAEAAVKAAKPLNRNAYKVQIAKTAVKRAIMQIAGLKPVQLRA